MPIHELIITGASFPEASVRGIIQTFEPIAESANIVRDINANSVNIGNPDFRKFRTTLTCADQVPPELMALWPGVTCTMTCVGEMTYLTTTGEPIRPYLAGSLRVDMLHTYYRPILEIRISEPWRIINNRWDADVSWQLIGEEV